jgi:malonate transporter and related proteins
MFEILTVTSPFFLLVLAGFIAARSGVLPLPAIPGLNAFVLYFGIPCMLFRFGANTPIEQLLNLPVAGLYLLCSLTLMGTVILVSRKRGLDWNNTAFGALVSTFPNTGFMGVPLLIALLGQAAAGPVIVSLFVDLVVISSLGIAISRLHDNHSGEFSVAFRKALRGMAVNPMPWAICLGGLASALSLSPPVLLDSTIRLLGDSASPVALFTIGAVLARSAMLIKSGENEKPIVQGIKTITALKMIGQPVLIFGVFQVANLLGAGIDPFTITVITLVGALPSASNIAILAERFHADSGRIAKIVLLTTSFTFFTFPLAVAILS